MNVDHDQRPIVIGLIGFRCCGKSELRRLLQTLGYPVFDTNCVRTGDSDANAIPLDEVLKRYGNDESYLNYIGAELQRFVMERRGVVFIDSLKVKQDVEVLRALCPGSVVELWYVHASVETRKQRYIERDIDTGVRSGSLEEHDAALERRGILALIKQAIEVINTEVQRKMLAECVEGAVCRVIERYQGRQEQGVSNERDITKP